MTVFPGSGGRPGELRFSRSGRCVVYGSRNVGAAVQSPPILTPARYIHCMPALSRGYQFILNLRIIYYNSGKSNFPNSLSLLTLFILRTLISCDYKISGIFLNSLNVIKKLFRVTYTCKINMKTWAVFLLFTLLLNNSNSIAQTFLIFFSILNYPSSPGYSRAVTTRITLISRQ